MTGQVASLTSNHFFKATVCLDKESVDILPIEKKKRKIKKVGGYLITPLQEQILLISTALTSC